MDHRKVGPQITYDRLAAFRYFEENLQHALNDCERVSIAVRNGVNTTIQEMVVDIVPTGMSLASSLLELVRLGHLPAAQIVLRSLLERAATLAFLSAKPAKIPEWRDGWKSGKPSLAQMLSHLSGGSEADARQIQAALVDGLNMVVHANSLGANAHWTVATERRLDTRLGAIPDRPEIAEKILKAGAFAVISLGSGARKAFILKHGRPPNSPKE